MSVLLLLKSLIFILEKDKNELLFYNQDNEYYKFFNFMIQKNKGFLF